MLLLKRLENRLTAYGCFSSADIRFGKTIAVLASAGETFGKLPPFWLVSGKRLEGHCYIGNEFPSSADRLSLILWELTGDHFRASFTSEKAAPGPGYADGAEAGE